MTKFEKLNQLMLDWGHYVSTKGRPVSAFSIDDNIDNHHVLTRLAYTRRLTHFKLLVAVDQNKPLKDPVHEVKIGSVYHPLWIYMHECLPDYPEKSLHSKNLRLTQDCNQLRNKSHEYIMSKFQLGQISDSSYAKSVLDIKRFKFFSQNWFERKGSNNSI